jgi:uncharacterized protein with beta-barrel porin domain
MRRPYNPPLAQIFLIGGLFTALMANQQHANAACLVIPTGTVSCNADTTTTNTTNLNGAIPTSSDRQQLFDNGAAINATVQSGVTVGGFGLQLTQGASTFQSLTVQNNGTVAVVQPVNALQIDGNGGSIAYSGNGAVTNDSGSGAALYVDSVGGNASISTGAGAITGATGIDATATGAGAVTITTGSGLVNGTAGPGISASTVNGPLSITVGSGGVTSYGGNNPAIAVTSTNGDILVTATGNVAGSGSVAVSDDIAEEVGGVHATSNGSGSITIEGSGTFFGQYGRSIWAQQSATGLGGILITGSGATLEGTTTLGCCSAIRAEIDNPADSSNIIVNRSGDIIAVTTLPSEVASSGIHAVTVGTGNIVVAGGAGATISNTGLFGIDSEAQGPASSGSINVSTGSLGTLTAGGTGIFAANSAFTIPASAGSQIAVTNNGTINSGADPNPVGSTFLSTLPYGEGASVTATPAGILAGYNGGPVFGPASGPYTSCGNLGCNTLTPNPNVSGTVSVVNNGAIDAAGGDGIFAFNFGNGNVSVTSTASITVTGATAQNGIEAFSAELGNISVTTTADVNTAIGSGIQTTSAGNGTTTVDVLAGTIQGGTSGITASSSGGAIQINNAGTIQNTSGQANNLAVATSGIGNATFTNDTGAVVTGTISMTGTGTNSFGNAGVWNTLGTSTFAGSSSVNNSGTINVFGTTMFSGLTTLTNGGVLNLAPGGGTIGALTITGNLVFQSSALYIVQVNPTTASLTSVTGTATLAGTASASFAAGGYVVNQYDILHAAGLNGTTFSGLATTDLPVNFAASLSYTPTDVLLSLTANLGTGGLNVNQQNVATTFNNFFNSGGALPPNFMNIFGLTGGNLAGALTQLDGEVAADSEFAAFQLMKEFLNLMLDPFVEDRLGGGGGAQAMGFARNEQATLPPDIALAYAAILKAPPPPFAQRWTAWGASYGGGDWTSGSAAAGSSNVDAQTYGFAGGMDYHYSPDTIFGFALAGGGTAWGLANANGSGRSDAFQAGVYGITRTGPAYLSAALAFTNHWMTTNRAPLGDALTASFDAQSYGVRIETGYRYAVLPKLGFGVTPYAALQAQDFHTPAYSETDLNGGGFGLSYAAMNATDTRTELGARFDDPMLIDGMPLILRARMAWAHDFVGDPTIGAVFQSLPGASFSVNGASIPRNSALTSAGAELFITPQITLLAKFNGEFAPASQTYGGSGTLRYTW